MGVKGPLQMLRDLFKVFTYCQERQQGTLIAPASAATTNGGDAADDGQNQPNWMLNKLDLHLCLVHPIQGYTGHNVGLGSYTACSQGRIEIHSSSNPEWWS
jgi:hypothetical protein